MYRTSKRSTSTPRLHASNLKRSTTPQGRQRPKEVDKPAWDDTCTDVTKYKATPQQIARRKQQRVSKNLVTLDKLCLTAATSPAPSLTPEAKSEGQHTTGTPEPTTSPVIDYGAVLKLLQRPSPSGQLPGTSQGPSTATGALPAQSSPSDDTRRGGDQQVTSTRQWAPDLTPQSQPTASSTNPPVPGSTSRVRQLLDSCDEVLDATFSSFARLDMTGTPQHTGHTTAMTAAAASQPPSVLRLPSELPLGRQGGDQQHGLRAAKAVVQDANITTTSAAVAAVQSRQQTLEQQVARLESAVQLLGSQAAAQPALPPALAQDLQSLKQVTSQLMAEQGRLRSDLDDFTRHTSHVISALQTQMHELLRSVLAPGPQHTSTAADLLAPLPGAAASTYTPASAHTPALSATLQQPSRSLFADLPSQSMARSSLPPQQPQQPALLRPQSSPVGSPSRSIIPVSNFDDQLSIPSYSAMRKSTAATSFTPSGSAAKGAQPPAARAAAGLPPNLRQSDEVPLAAQRTLPAPYAPRVIGDQGLVSRPLPASLAHITGTSAALGPTLPVSSYGEAQVGSLADYVAADWERGGPAPGASFRGSTSAFGVLPEPLTFNMASDFKIVRVGGAGGVVTPSTGLTAENSLSLAAHTAAAMRAKAGRK